MSIEFWLFLPICCFGFAGWLSFRATLRRFTRFNGFLPLCVPFGDPKGTEKVPATSDSARLAAHNERRHPAKRARSCGSMPHWGIDRCATPQPRLRGYSPLRTPKMWSAGPKAKNCRSAAIFLTLLGRLPYSPLRGVKYSISVQRNLAPEGSIGEKQKSVKNRAALLHGLAFLLLDLLFGVLRGEQPLSRAPRLGTSGTFLLLFWSQKSRHSGRRPL